MELLYADTPAQQYLSECGIEEEPYICLSAEQSSVKSTKDLGHVHGLYATRKEATTRSQDSKDGRKLVQILRLIKSILEPVPQLEFTVSSLQDGNDRGSRQPVDEFSDRLRYLIISSTSFSTIHPALPSEFVNDLISRDRAASGYSFRALTPKLFLWAGATSLAFISHLPTSPWRSLPTIFFAGFIISLQLAQRTPEEELAWNQTRLLRELECFLTDSTALDSVFEQALKLIRDSEEEYVRSGRVSRKIADIPDPLIMPAFARSRSQSPHPIHEPLLELRETLYQSLAQTIKVFERASEQLECLTLQDELLKLTGMYAPEPENLPTHDRLIGHLKEPGSPVYRSEKISRRPVSEPVNFSAAGRRQSWSPSLIENSPPPSGSPLARSRSGVRRRESLRTHPHGTDSRTNQYGLGIMTNKRDRSSLPPLYDTTNLQRSPLLPPAMGLSHSTLSLSTSSDQMYGCHSTPKQLLLDRSPVPQQRVRNRLSSSPDIDASNSWSSSNNRSPKRFSFLQPSSPLSPHLESEPSSLSQDPFSAINLQLSFEKMQRARRKLLCYYLALDFPAVYPSIINLVKVVRVVRELKDANAFMEQDVKHAIQVATAEDLRYPGSWSSISPQRPDMSRSKSDNSAPSKRASTRLSVYSELSASQRQRHSRSSETLRDFAPPSLADLSKTRNEYTAYEKKTWMMGEQLRTVATKLNSSAESLRVQVDEADQRADQDGVELLIAQHDSIRENLEGLIRNWDESRLLLRNLVGRPEPSQGRQAKSTTDSLSEYSNRDTKSELRASTSAFTVDTQLTTPDSMASPTFVDGHDFYKSEDFDHFKADPEAREEIFEAVVGPREDSARLSREERIRLMKERRMQEQAASLNKLTGVNQPMLTELKDVISSLKQKKIN